MANTNANFLNYKLIKNAYKQKAYKNQKNIIMKAQNFQW